MRIAVTQFATHSNYQENLKICLGMIDKASDCNPDIILMPEFCNSLPRYVDHNQAWNEAVPMDGEFIQAIAKHAQIYQCYIVINVTLRCDQSRDHHNSEIKSKISITSCVLSPSGELIFQQDKRNLSEHESLFFTQTIKSPTALSTTFGKIGLLQGNETERYDTPRKLMLSSTKLLCNSLSTSTLDQCQLHDLARASENKVFFASSYNLNTLPLTHQRQDSTYHQNKYLKGIGQSQIISPSGKILAKLPYNKESYVFADINLADANMKFRPDGTNIVEQRIPELYQHNVEPLLPPQNKIPITANIAIFATYKTNEDAIDDVCHYIENNLSDIIQLPELFFLDDKNLTYQKNALAHITQLSCQVISRISAVLRVYQYVCTSVILDGVHQAILINHKGIFARQQQLHYCQRYQWTTLGTQLNIIKVPLEQGQINVAILTADDAHIPELIDLAASRGIHLLLAPLDIQEASEVDFNLLSRAAEHRICIAAASKEKNFIVDSPVHCSELNTIAQNKESTKKSTGFIASLTVESDVLPQWKSQKYNGFINKPVVKYQYGKITKAIIHPLAATRKNS